MALGKGDSQQGSEAGDPGTCPELFTPTGVRDEVQIDNGGDEVSSSVSLLEDSTSKTTSFDGKVFESSSGSQPPDTSHADTEKTSDGKEFVEGLSEAASEGERGDEEKVGNQGPLSSVSIGNETKDDL